MICMPFASLLRPPRPFSSLPLPSAKSLAANRTNERVEIDAMGRGERGGEVLWFRRTDCGIAAAANCLGISLSHYSQQQCKALFFSLPLSLSLCLSFHLLLCAICAFAICCSLNKFYGKCIFIEKYFLLFCR